MNKVWLVLTITSHIHLFIYLFFNENGVRAWGNTEAKNFRAERDLEIT